MGEIIFKMHVLNSFLSYILKNDPIPLLSKIYLKKGTLLIPNETKRGILYFITCFSCYLVDRKIFINKILSQRFLVWVNALGAKKIFFMRAHHFGDK